MGVTALLIAEYNTGHPINRVSEVIGQDLQAISANRARSIDEGLNRCNSKDKIWT